MSTNQGYLLALVGLEAFVLLGSWVMLVWHRKRPTKRDLKFLDETVPVLIWLGYLALLVCAVAWCLWGFLNWLARP